MLHHAGLGIGSLKFDTELLNQKRADEAMTVPDSRTNLAAAIGQDHLAVVRLLDKFGCFERRNRFIDRCLGDAKALRDVDRSHAIGLPFFAFDANHALQVVFVRHRQV